MNLEKKYVKDVYEKISKHFSNTRAFTWSWVYEFITSLDKGSLILDIGCGNGRNMNNQNYNFIGIDNCKGFLNICRTKGLDVIESDMTKIPLSDNIFDHIICIASFHHLSSLDNRIQSLLEIKRLVKFGGKILLSVWSIKQPLKTRRIFREYGDTIVKYNKFGEIYDRYYYIFNIDEIKNLFNIVGLSIIKHFYDCGNEVFILTK